MEKVLKKVSAIRHLFISYLRTRLLYLQSSCDLFQDQHCRPGILNDCRLERWICLSEMIRKGLRQFHPKTDSKNTVSRLPESRSDAKTDCQVVFSSELISSISSTKVFHVLLTAGSSSLYLSLWSTKGLNLIREAPVMSGLSLRSLIKGTTIILFITVN